MAFPLFGGERTYVYKFVEMDYLQSLQTQTDTTTLQIMNDEHVSTQELKMED